jgi:2-keto-4-pentenoate hydratase/2-oxohepta-3-ene-1,7-dioic acid hydratase in catechol pathway
MGMRLGSVAVGPERRVAVETAEGVRLMPAELWGRRIGDVDDLLAIHATDGSWARIAETVAAGAARWPLLTEGAFRWRPVVQHPQKILCIGRNYRAHAAETHDEVPTEPLVFAKMANTLAAAGDAVPLPRRSQEIDYEAELVVVMGRRARDVAEHEALAYVAGYTAGNDVSARDLQFLNGQWLLGKSCDGFAPIGPWLVTPDAVGDPQALGIQLLRNGVVAQQGHTRDMVFSCAFLIHYLSTVWTLEPGDLIFSGTPDGVIFGKPPGERRWLTDGDVTEVVIEKVGRLVNTFGRGPADAEAGAPRA